MSTTINYMPNTDNDRIIWLNNFVTKITNYATPLNITAAEITALQKDVAMYVYVINMLEAYKQTVNNLTSYKNLLKHAVGQQHLGALPTAPTLATPPSAVSEGVFDRLSKMIKRLKASTNYTDAIGNDLGIIAATQTIDVNSLQPD